MKRRVVLALLCLAASLAVFAATQPGGFQTRRLTQAFVAATQPFAASAAQSAPRRERRTLGNFDIRADLDRSLASPPSHLRPLRAKQLRALGVSAAASEESPAHEAGTRTRWSSLTGTPSRFINLQHSAFAGRGAAVEGSSDNTEEIEDVARDFFRGRRELFRLSDDEVRELRVARRFRSEASGLTHVTLAQRVGGIEVFQGRYSIHLDRAGVAVSAAGELIPEAARHVNAARPGLASAEALRRAAEFADAELKTPAAPRVAADTPEQTQTFDQSAGFARDVEARLVYFPLTATSLRLAWEFTLWLADSPDVYLIVVDAERGSLLYRFNYTTYEDNPLQPHGLVFTAESPRPASPYAGNDNPPIVGRADVPFRATPFNGAAIFNPGDKHYDWWAGQSASGLVSNNADAHLDRSPADNIADEPRLLAADGNFSFPLDFTLAPTEANNQRAAQVNLFYWVNRYHDILYSFGFDEAAGNFQADNFGLGGAGGDAIQADAQDAGGTNNANFSTPPDGRAGRVQMYLWSGAPMLDGDFDQGIIIHELTHGLTNRLVGDGAGLTGMQAQGMGEGWSDYFSLVLLRKEGDDADGVYPVGQYVRGNYAKGIRRYPYSTSLNVNPLTFGHVALNTEVHRVGEIWCGLLWEVRAALVKKYGFQAGQRQSIQLVVDGLKLTPNAPTFVEARDAILLADRVTNGGANQCLLWQAFSKRGLGYSAETQGVDDPAPQESFDAPPFCNDSGSVRLDKANYLVGERASVSVGDRNASSPVRVQVMSTATGDRETLTLTPDGVYAGAFNGNFRVAAGGAVPGDGAVQASVEAGDQIKVTYLDSDTGDGNGSGAAAAATAGVVREKTVFEDGVEGGNQGWIAAGGWAISSTRSASPSRSWTDSPAANYAANSAAALTSALFDCAGLSEVTLSFAHSFDFESGFDFGLVEFSIDDGATWTRAASFTGRGATFAPVSLPLDALDNQPRARVRFRLQSDASVSADGWYVDDIRLAGRSANPNVVKPGNPNSPAVSTITPAFGPVVGGTELQITGQNFTDSADTTVTFDGVPARAVRVVSSAVMFVITPPQPAAQAKVVALRIANRSGEVAVPQGFTYYNAGSAMKAPTLTSVFPASGSTRGGAVVTLVGAEFTPETAVSFNSIPAVTTYVNPYTLRILSPVMGAAGAADVTVTNAGQAATLKGAFTYYAPTPPSAKLVSPQGGETLFINQTVTIRWNSSDNRALSRHRVALYRTVGGSTVPLVDIAEVTGEAQSVNWTIPASTGVMTNARVRVLAVDDEGAETEAFSSGDFTIARRWEAQAALPAASQRLAVVSDGNNLYALGGRAGAATTTGVDAVSRFNAAGNAWVSAGLAKMPAAVNSSDAAVLGGKIYVPGGMVNGAASAAHHVYDIAANSWATLALAPGGVHSFAVAADAERGVYYLTGGASGTVTTSAVRAYDPQTNAWSDLPPMKAARHGHRAVVIEGKLYVVGGFGVTGGMAGGEVYDFASRQWSLTASLNRPRAFAAGAVIQDAGGNPLWLVVGGEDPVTRTPLQSAEVYDARRNRWLALDNSFNLASARTQLGGAALNGYFYAVGGGTLSTTSPASSAAVERLRVTPFAASDAGQPPALAVTPAQIAIAGRELKFEVRANDLNSGAPLLLTADALPANASFVAAPASQTTARGTFSWTPQDADTGRTFTVSFTASDGEFSETKAVTIRVVTASPLTVVNAANYRVGALPADSIATAFGTNLAARVEFAATLPLPTEMAGTRVTVNGVAAQLFYVSPTQINFVMPPTVEAGQATIIVSHPAGSYALGTSEITDAAPAVFTADSTGGGDAAAVATADGLIYETGPFSVSVNGRQNILLLFGTGFRHAQAANRADENGVAESVKVTVEGQEARVFYAGAQPQFVGLDQLNVELPASLQPGARRAEVVVYLNGVEANRVTVQIK